MDRNVVTLGESLTLSLHIEGGRAGQPTLPAIPNFAVVGTGSTIQIINGQVQQAFTYELSPTAAGDLMIPALQLNLGGQVTTTQPISIKVLRPGEAQLGGMTPPAFAQIALPKARAFVGEVIDLEVQVYSQGGRLTQYPQLPPDSGFTIGKWLRPTESRIALSNQPYSLVSFKVPITIVKAGSINAGPATLPLLVPNRNRRTIFDPHEREERLIGKPVTILARSLPTNNVPPSFAGAVGQFSVAMTAVPTNVAVGDPITARVELTGRGWFDAVTLPAQQWKDFKTYPPTSKIEARDQNNIVGAKMFELAIVPRTPEVKAVPPFEFSFFDPEAAVYRTVTAPAVPVTVRPGAASTVPVPNLANSTNNIEQSATDIAHIKVRLGTLAATTPLILRPWFIALQLVPPVFWAVMLIRRKRFELMERNPRLRRRREMERFVRHGIKRLSEAAADNQSEQFFATLTRILQEQLGERLDVPGNSITEAVIDDRLRPGGLPAETCEMLHKLFQASNMARFSPLKSSQELSALVPQVEAVSSQLRRWNPGWP